MKKGTSFFYIVISILCLMLFSCNIRLEDTELMRKPDFDRSEKQVTIMVHKINSSTDYINIYRKETSGDEMAIGLIFPKDIKNNTMIYTFIDSLVKDNETYRYKARYHDSKGYHYSDWTDEIKIENFPNAYAADDVLTYESNGAKFSLNSTDFSISLTSALTAPEAITNFDQNENELLDFKPMLIVSTTEANNKKTQVFELDYDFIYDKKAISLRGLLPLDFMDTPIIISGILGQKIEYQNPDITDPEKLVTKFISWTEPVDITIAGHSDNTVTIPSQSGAAGYDYSRHAK